MLSPSSPPTLQSAGAATHSLQDWPLRMDLFLLLLNCDLNGKITSASELSQRKRSRQTSCLAIIWFSPFSRQWQYKGNNERTKNKEIFTRTWVWGLVLRVRVRSVRVWNVRVTSSASKKKQQTSKTKNHLNVLEAVYISVLNPVLCKQKSFVTSLTLFQRTQRTHPP